MKFATEVKSIEEQVKLKQIMSGSPYSGCLNDLLDQETKYNDKLIVEDGILKYISDNSTLNEIEWFKRLGVEKASDYYTIDFDPLNEMKEIDSKKIRTGYSVSPPENPIKDGYKFLGWYYLDEEGTEDNVLYNEKKFDFSTKVTRNYSLYAKYSGEAVMKSYKENEDFWKYKTEITSIYFKKQKIPDNLPTLHWNIEESDECSNIVAYLENDNLNGGYKLTIVSPLIIYANADTTSYFDGFTTLEYIDFSNFNTSKSRTMYRMFYGCKNLSLADVTKFNTSKVENMESMFKETGYTEMTTLDLGENFDTSSVMNMISMFEETGHEKMTTLNLGERFNTSQVINMSNMFKETGYKAMTSLDLGNVFYTTSVSNTSGMFDNTGATAMTILDLGPVFNRIPENNTDMFKNTGTNELIVYAPESIYSNVTTFIANRY